MPGQLIGAGVEFLVAQGGGFALNGDAFGEGPGGVLEPAAQIGMGRGDGNRRGAQRLGGLLGVQQRRGQPIGVGIFGQRRQRPLQIAGHILHLRRVEFRLVPGQRQFQALVSWIAAELHQAGKVGFLEHFHVFHRHVGQAQRLSVDMKVDVVEADFETAPAVVQLHDGGQRQAAQRLQGRFLGKDAARQLRPTAGLQCHAQRNGVQEEAQRGGAVFALGAAVGDVAGAGGGGTGQQRQHAQVSGEQYGFERQRQPRGGGVQRHGQFGRQHAAETADAARAARGRLRPQPGQDRGFQAGRPAVAAKPLSAQGRSRLVFPVR
ncbi:hypothetical protein JOS77_18290 [Chromobacterium haemolyticum]|nr:hypothetical protein JOS77_18290 [Chromobacterium haemolyticum]